MSIITFLYTTVLSDKGCLTDILDLISSQCNKHFSHSDSEQDLNMLKDKNSNSEQKYTN